MTRRIGFVINQLGGVGAGGSDRVISVLANEFAARGWHVDILALTGDNTVERELAPEITVHFEKPIASSAKLAQVGLRMTRGAGLVRSYAKRYPDAVIVSFIAWVNMCTIAGVTGVKHGPVILSERTDPASDPASAPAQRLRNAAYRRADAVVFQTPDAQAYFDGMLGGASRIIPNPVAPGLPKWKQPRSGMVVVTAARLEDEKNIPLLIDAFAPIANDHPEARLRIFGEGKQRAQLQAHIDETGLSDRITLEGFTPDVHAELAQASMYAMSSNFEGMPNSLLEALCMGMPAASVDCPIGAPRMMIEDHVNGLLTPVGDVDAMSKAMRYLLENPKQAKAMGAKAAELSETFATARIADEWEQLIASLDSRGTSAND